MAWRDYVAVLPNLLAGGADEATNVAPWSMVARSGWPAIAGELVRAASVLVAIGATVGAVLVIRRPMGAIPAATLATIAMLLLPAALWYHYLVVLLPIGILAWPPAGPRARAALVVAGACISAAVAWLPLATLGAALFLIVSLAVQLRSTDAVSRPAASAPT